MVAIIKLLVLALTASATPLVYRDVITVQNDITQKIGPQINTLNKDVSGFPASGLTGALAIHGDVQTLVSTVNTAITNIKSTGSFGTVSGTTILANIQAIVPDLLATLENIGLQEPSWAQIAGGQALMLSDLHSLNTAFSNYMDAIIGAEPLLLKSGGVAIKAQITGAFTTAIAAYSYV
ncbi:hypothetical protein VE01_08249 [Pseudogymnoascus verrucosus]|uniref:Uncharacterized protein n=1 Tax=Pseudogymnoascus verrucosus TaxID=342668 RepID=A0A1B8GDN1_9PEZI|nr:uncharacterized protein VE01_08249 [Pseudogymnoascus verrucosus]OBT93936.1 hypothetical protein VE01_08249 [Pseudogymnoascus verrucosus]